MRFIVTGTKAQMEELKKGSSADTEWILSGTGLAEGDAFFFLNDRINWPKTFPAGKPVFINSVTYTLKALGTPENILRINGWNSFLARQTWELAGKVDAAVTDVFTALGKKMKPVADEPGLVVARVIAMIVNEAYFALEETVSSKAEIDTAMKLGTNYPYGPFEWSAIIGLPNIYELLHELGKTDNRFAPSLLLTKEALTA